MCKKNDKNLLKFNFYLSNFSFDFNKVFGKRLNDSCSINDLIGCAPNMVCENSICTCDNFSIAYEFSCGL